MVEQVIISTNEPERVRPLIQSAIRRELSAFDSGIKRTRSQLTEFERRFGMTTFDFQRRFGNRELPESLDFLDWWMEVTALERLIEQRRVLSEARLD